MEENRKNLEIRLQERKAQFHRAQAELPFEEKLQVLDELQEAAESIRPFREQILGIIEQDNQLMRKLEN